MTDSKIASRYAKALIELAKEQNLRDIVYEDMKFIYDLILESKELASYFRNPIIRPYKKNKAMVEIFQQRVNNLTFRFLDLLIKKTREKNIVSICEKFFELYDVELNRVQVEISTANPMNDKSKNEIERQLHLFTGKTIQSKYKIDKKILGGFQAKFEDYIYDATISQRLKSLKDELVNDTKKVNY
jgi:F-type H+-transporting ATPase subunit delta